MWRMVKPARFLLRTASDLTLDRLRSDEEKQYSVAKALELIGEAARSLSESFPAAHPDIPWIQISGMRNILVHQYHRADWDLIWTTITVRVPAFLAQIEQLLPVEPPVEPDDMP